jgi:hypothetical protein
MLTFMDCPHSQILLGPREMITVARKVPVVTYLADEDEELEPGNAMTCVTCDRTQVIASVTTGWSSDDPDRKA